MTTVAAASAGFLLLAAAATAAVAADPRGVWRLEGGEAAIRILACGDRLCGRIVWLAPLSPEAGNPPRDRRNPDPWLRERPLCGLTMLWGFQPDGPGRWAGGSVYNPQDGETYRGTMTLGPADRLEVRGYVGLPLFGKSQTGTRVPEPRDACG